jgi:hypothetical protein
MCSLAAVGKQHATVHAWLASRASTESPLEVPGPATVWAVLEGYRAVYGGFAAVLAKRIHQGV